MARELSMATAAPLPACELCRSAHTCCSRDLPSCQRCMKRGAVCIYPKKRGRRRKRRKEGEGHKRTQQQKRKNVATETSYGSLLPYRQKQHKYCDPLDRITVHQPDPPGICTVAPQSSLSLSLQNSVNDIMRQVNSSAASFGDAKQHEKDPSVLMEADQNTSPAFGSFSFVASPHFFTSPPTRETKEGIIPSAMVMADEAPRLSPSPLEKETLLSSVSATSSSAPSSPLFCDRSPSVPFGLGNGENVLLGGDDIYDGDIDNPLGLQWETLSNRNRISFDLDSAMLSLHDSEALAISFDSFPPLHESTPQVGYATRPVDNNTTPIISNVSNTKGSGRSGTTLGGEPHGFNLILGKKKHEEKSLLLAQTPLAETHQHQPKLTEEQPTNSQLVDSVRSALKKQLALEYLLEEMKTAVAEMKAATFHIEDLTLYEPKSSLSQEKPPALFRDVTRHSTWCTSRQLSLKGVVLSTSLDKGCICCGGLKMCNNELRLLLGRAKGERFIHPSLLFPPEEQKRIWDQDVNEILKRKLAKKDDYLRLKHKAGFVLPPMASSTFYRYSEEGRLIGFTCVLAS